MTHAEAAPNRDGRVMHDSYGPLAWGGSGERWDFMQLRKGGPADGGEEFRRRIHFQMRGEIKPSPGKPPLAFGRTSSMTARGSSLEVEIDANGTSWALVVELLALYDIPYEWNPGQRRILIGSTEIAPTYREDGVQASIGHPLFEMGLQGGNSPVILQGIMRDDRAWCRVLEFAEEFGITAFFEPFALGERRGG